MIMKNWINKFLNRQKKSYTYHLIGEYSPEIIKEVDEYLDCLMNPEKELNKHLQRGFDYNHRLRIVEEIKRLQNVKGRNNQIFIDKLIRYGKILGQ